MRDVTRAMLTGAIAGIVGGFATTAYVKGLIPKMVPPPMRPDGDASERTVQWAERQAGHPDALSPRAEARAALAAHLAYSAAAGALYGAARREAPGVPASLAGLLFGLAVWATGPEGWIPALGIMPATHTLPPRQWPVPISTHLVFGGVTAAAYHALSKVAPGGLTRAPR